MPTYVSHIPIYLRRYSKQTQRKREASKQAHLNNTIHGEMQRPACKLLRHYCLSQWTSALQH